jgi:hypothetical protein
MCKVILLTGALLMHSQEADNGLLNLEMEKFLGKHQGDIDMIKPSLIIDDL